VNSLAARKKALVAESEVYRQALRIELQNVRLYAVRMRRKVEFFNSAKPLLLLLPLVGSLLAPRFKERPKKKARGWRRWLGTGLLGWKMYRSVAPILQTIGSLKQRRGQWPMAERTERSDPGTF